MRKTPGGHIHHPHAPSSRASYLRREAALGGRSFALVGFCRRKARHGMIEPTRQRPRHRDGRPRAARICGGRLPRCRATAILPPSRILAKMRLGGKIAVARQRGRRPPQILAARGRPSRWRGRWRVGSIIPCRAFLRQKPTSAKLRPPRAASRRKYDAREDGA